jgi:hypothetical protein
MREGLRALVKEAIEAGELRRCDPNRLAWALEAAINGSLLGWAVHRQGDLAAWIRRDIKTILEPYRAKSRR